MCCTHSASNVKPGEVTRLTPEILIICPSCGGRVVYGADSSSLATYGVIHMSLRHISAQDRILSYFHLYISFRLTLWVACVPLESSLAYNMYLSNLQIEIHMLIKIKIL